jgi:glycosyltransferase involved in cell wall biosynthesis
VPVATVIVPTHSHAATLPLSVRSALSQTEQDVELIVVGDGVDEPTREAAQRLAAADERVRFVDNPKGEGHGFEHRHQAVIEAESNRVFWLADDDLWFPDHVERLGELLENAHLATSLVVGALPDGSARVKPFDLGISAHRAALAAGERFIPMVALAHRRKAYLKLPRGWNVGGTNYRQVWTQFAQQPKFVTASILAPTSLHLATTNSREELPQEQRAAELERWSAVLADEGLRRRFLEDVIARLVTTGWLERAQARYEADDAADGGSGRQSGTRPAKARRGRAASRSERTTSSRETGQGTPRSGSSKTTPSSSSASQ